jgi:hypothetical protein
MALEQFQNNELPEEVPAQAPEAPKQATREKAFADDATIRLQQKRLEYDAHLQNLIDKVSQRQQLNYNPRLLALGAGLLTPGKTGNFFEGLGLGTKGYMEAGEKELQTEMERAKLENELRLGQIGQIEKDRLLKKELKSQQMLEDFIARKRLPQTQGGQSGVGLDNYLDLAKSGDVEITPQDIVMFSLYDKDKAALLEKLYDNQMKAKELGQKQFGKTSRFLPVLNEVSENLTVQQNDRIDRMINRNATDEEFLSYYENQGIIPRRAVKQKLTPISATEGVSEVSEATEPIKGPMARQREKELEQETKKLSTQTKFKIQEKDLETVSETNKAAQDLQIAARQMYDIANNPATQSMFGKLANPKYSSIALKALQEPLRVGPLAVGIGNIEELAVMAGGNQQEINALKQFMKPASEAELGYTRIFLSKQGQITEGERVIVRRIIPQVGDPFSVVKAKSELMIARSQFEDQKSKLFTDYIDKNMSGTMNDFMKTPQYKKLFESYDKHTADIANSYLPNSVKAPSGKKSTTSSGLWESIQRAKEPQ